MTNFFDKVAKTVKQVPFGHVVSYGQIAAHLDKPRAAQAVGWALRQMEIDETIPWWRVINNKGYISIKGNMFHTAQMQADLLKKEGIVVNKDFEIAIEKYRYQL